MDPQDPKRAVGDKWGMWDIQEIRALERKYHADRLRMILAALAILVGLAALVAVAFLIFWHFKGKT